MKFAVLEKFFTKTGKFTDAWKEQSGVLLTQTIESGRAEENDCLLRMDDEV
ncbi:MAG: hypothetical protein IT210_05380 [Armatimonadetes bacterium]|nr:hypothetical protein [Armatimonadota bacterium]